jgi:hypothetical protein
MLINEGSREMANYKFLLDNSVCSLAQSFPKDSTLQLADIGLPKDASDEQIIDAGSQYIMVTTNRKHFEPQIDAYVATSSRKPNGCSRVEGLIILLANDKHIQKLSIERASKQLIFEAKAITWKEVHDRCLKVIIEASGKARVSKLPRCRHCNHGD